MCAEGVPCNTGWPAPLAEIAAFRPHVEPQPTPVTACTIAESVWLDQRLFLVDEGAAQVVDAVRKIQHLAATLSRRK
jgi:hypothetical protein